MEHCWCIVQYLYSMPSACLLAVARVQHKDLGCFFLQDSSVPLHGSSVLFLQQLKSLVLRFVPNGNLPIPATRVTLRSDARVGVTVPFLQSAKQRLNTFATEITLSITLYGMGPKRILFIHPDLGIGGAERLVIDAAVGLQERGHVVTIYTSHCDRRHCFDEARNGITLQPPTLPFNVVTRAEMGAIQEPSMCASRGIRYSRQTSLAVSVSFLLFSASFT